jgi:hypothetical protein
MKNVKLSVLSILAVIGIIAGSRVLLDDSTKQNCNLDCASAASQAEEQNQVAENTPDVIEVEKAPILSKHEETVAHVDSDKSRNLKSFDGDWCIAANELSQDDFNYAQTELRDWEEYIGSGFAKSQTNITADDSFYANNAYVASYQELALDDLEQRALDGDKWAMITFVQKWSANEEVLRVQREVAQQLLIEGASYHAIEFLILDELTAAEITYAETRNIEDSAEHLKSAIAYVMLGLRDYNKSALTAYVGSVSRKETFQEVLNPSVILTDAQGDIREKYEGLVKHIDQKREEESIVVQQPPRSVEKLFSETLAFYHHRDGDILKHLNSLQITSEVNLSETKCTQKHVAALAKIDADYDSLYR